MTPQNNHKDDWKLLLAVGGLVIVGAAAIAAVWGVWHFLSGGAMILFFRALDKRRATQ